MSNSYESVYTSIQAKSASAMTTNEKRFVSAYKALRQLKAADGASNQESDDSWNIWNQEPTEENIDWRMKCFYGAILRERGQSQNSGFYRQRQL